MIQENLFKEAYAAIADVHAQDIKTETFDGKDYPSELLYSERMHKALLEFDENADYIMQLAALCQHFERWVILRSIYPMDKKGYYDWRKGVMAYQLERTAEVLTSCGVVQEDIDEIADILLNRGKKGHEKGQVMEDVACIVFVECYLEAFAAKHEMPKVLDIVTKTVKKISEAGMQAILKRPLSDAVQNILKQL